MLQLFYSKARKCNSLTMYQSIHDSVIHNDGKHFLIVPEQFSHMVERTLCEVCGDAISRYAEVLGFSRLAVRVFSEVGGVADTETDEAGRLMMMSLTVEQLRSRLKLYGSRALKPGFLLQMSETIEELRSFCISPEVLREAAATSEGALAVKLEELALLMEGFDSICKHIGQNPESRLNRLLTALETSDFAKGKVFFFDGFTDFNGVELQIIERLLRDGAQVHVYLHLDTLDSVQQQFSAARATAVSLLRIAKRAGVETRCKELPTQEKGSAFEYLRGHLFGGERHPSEEEEQICFIEGPGVIGECRIAAGEILKLLEHGTRLREISIACADYAAYRSALQTVLRRAELPAYFAGDTDILRQPVVHTLLSALEAASSLEQSAVLQYLKCGYTGLSFDQCDQLENYILTWNIQGLRFQQEWSMNPSGIHTDATAEDLQNLQQINESRAVFTVPLMKLRQGLRSAKNTGQMLLALNEFMEQIKLNEQLYAIAERMTQAGEFQKAQQYAQVYSIICTLMEQMFGVLGETVRDVEDFMLLFRTAVSLYTMGTIPATLDCISVGSLSSQRRNNTKYLFILGANEGAFPAVQNNPSLLSDMERNALLEMGLQISPTAAGRLDRELSMIDSLLEAPACKLYFGAVKGKGSFYYQRARALFPKAKVVLDDQALILRSRRDYENYYADPSPYVFPKLHEQAVRALYGNTLRLSSSKIESLAACRLAYFLRYGLRAKERETAEVDASLYGIFVHYVLEKTCQQVHDEGGFHKVPLEHVLQIADKRMNEYADVILADLWQSERSEYLFRRNFTELRSVVELLYREMSASAFEPSWFELNFSNQPGSLPVIRLQGRTVTAELEGSVDRADLCRQGNQLYVRVIDYKTGHTSFDFTKVYHGLGMQMLIYLSAVCDNAEQLVHEPLFPAGVLYFPAKIEKEYLSDRSEYLNLLKEPSFNVKRTGLVLSDMSVLEAMDATDGFQYLPCSVLKNGTLKGSVADSELFALIGRHVRRKVGELADELYSGVISPEPYYISTKNHACTYCPYSAVCKNKSVQNKLSKLEPDQFWTLLKEADQHG